LQFPLSTKASNKRDLIGPPNAILALCIAPGVPPLAGGKATLYSLSSNAGPSGLSVASDGTVWFAEQTLSQVGRIAPGASQAEEWACPNPHAYPVQILATPAGQVFYTDQNASAVVMFSAAAQGKGSPPKLAGSGGPPAAPGTGAQAATPHSVARLQGAQGAPVPALHKRNPQIRQ